MALFTNTAYAQRIEYSTTTAPQIIEAYAAHYGISSAPLLATLRCESHLDSSAAGDHNTSFGVAQIHLPAHKDITKAEALDPFFSIDFAASEFAAGRQYEWSCYKILYGNNSA